jgi:pentatricopeptide repeat protein
VRKLPPTKGGDHFVIDAACALKPHMQCMCSLKSHNIVQDGFTYSAALGCCIAALDVENTMMLVREMRNSNIRPTKMAHVTAISNCDGRRAQYLLECAKDGYPNDSISMYNSIFVTLNKSQRHDDDLVGMSYWQELYEKYSNQNQKKMLSDLFTTACPPQLSWTQPM